jgi:hypothetical protein
MRLRPPHGGLSDLPVKKLENVQPSQKHSEPLRFVSIPETEYNRLCTTSRQYGASLGPTCSVSAAFGYLAPWV